MCRLLGYVSYQKQTFNSAVGSDFSEFVTLSSVHCDGWGVATIDHNQNVAQMIRQPEAANKSKDFSTAIEKSVSDGALLHLRWQGGNIQPSLRFSIPTSGPQRFHGGGDCIHSGLGFRDMGSGSLCCHRSFILPDRAENY